MSASVKLVLLENHVRRTLMIALAIHVNMGHVRIKLETMSAFVTQDGLAEIVNR